MCEQVNIVREAREGSFKHDVGGWHYDYIIHKTNQRGDIIYWVRRCFSDSRRKINGPKCLTVEDAYSQFYNMIERQSFDSFSLGGLRYDVPFIKMLPLFSEEIIHLITLILNLNELYNAGAESRAYAMLLITNFVHWSGHKISLSDLQQYANLILNYLRSRFNLGDNNDDLTMSDISIIGKTFKMQDYSNESKVHKIDYSYGIQRQVVETKPFKFVNDLLSVGAGLFAVMTLPSLTNIHHIKNHLSVVSTEYSTSSYADVASFLYGLCKSTYALFVSIYFACAWGKTDALFKGYISDSFHKIELCHRNINSYSTTDDNPNLPYKHLTDYEFNLEILLRDLKNGAGVLTDADRREKIALLTAWKLELSLDRFKNRPRRAPFVICLHGGTSIGKSSLTNYLLGVYAKIFNIDMGSHIGERVYKHNPTAKHWDNCKSTHWAYVFDDIARERDATTNMNGASTDSIIDVVGNLPFFPPMARLEEKGNVACLPRICILTTNNKGLNAHQTHHTPAALRRRVHFYVTAEPAEGLRNNRGYLDSARAELLPEAEQCDLWLFSVDQADVDDNPSQPENPHTVYNRVTYNINGEIRDLTKVRWDIFCQWYCHAIVQHDANQKHVVDVMTKHAMNMDYCVNCRYFHPGKKNDLCQKGSFLIDRQSNEFFPLFIRNWFKILYKKIYHLWFSFIVTTKNFNCAWYPDVVQKIFISELGYGLEAFNIEEEQFLSTIRRLKPALFLRGLSHYFKKQIVFKDGICVGLPECGSIFIDIDFPLISNEFINSGGFDLMLFLSEYFDIILFFIILICLWLLLPLLLFVWLFGLMTHYYYVSRTRIVCKIMRFFLREKYVQLRQILLFLSGLSLLFVAYTTFKHFSSPYKTAARHGLETSKMPKDEKGNSWFEQSWLDNTRVHKPFTFSHQSATISSDSVNYQQLLKNIRNNTLYVSTHDLPGSDRTGFGYCLAINSTTLLINVHTLVSQSTGGKYKRLRLYKYNLGSKRKELKCEVQIDKTNHVQIAPDLMLIRVPHSMDVKSLIEYFHRNDCEAVMSARRELYTGEDGDISIKTTTANTAYVTRLPEPQKDFYDECYPDGNFPKYEEVWIMRGCSETSYKGESGSCWLSDRCGVSMILGIHVGSTIDHQLCGRVTRELLDHGLDELSKRQIVKGFDWVAGKAKRDSSEMLWDAGGLTKLKVGDFRDVDVRAFANYIEPHSGEPLYTVNRYAPNHRTEMHWHISRDYWISKGILCKSYIPDLSAFRKSSWYIGITELNGIPLCVPQEALQICAKHYTDSVLFRLENVVDWREYFGKFDIQRAIHGDPFMKYVDRMNPKSSAGWPIFEKKKHFMFNDLVGYDYIPPWLVDRVNFLIRNYEDGNRSYSIFTAHQKDEFISEKKFKNGRLRVFMGSPIDFTVVVRMYLLSFVRVMQKFRHIFECAVAIVAQNTDWSDFHDYISKGGSIKRFIAGDYEHYDKGMHIYVLEMASTVILSIVSASGKFSEIDLRVIQLIMMDIINCVVDYDGTLMLLFGSNPSGHPLTVLLNCIAGSIYVRLAYLRKFSSLEHFNNEIVVGTYGDDNLIGVVDGVDFSFHDMRDKLSDIASYTTSDKQKEGDPWVSISSANFLKRGFLYNGYLSSLLKRDIYTAPIELSSIWKILHGGKGSLSEMEALSVSLKTALGELAFHESHIYDKYSEMIYDCASYYKLADVSRISQENRLRRWFNIDPISSDEANYGLAEDQEIIRQADNCVSYLVLGDNNMRGIQDSKQAFYASVKNISRETGEKTWAGSPFITSANFIEFDEAPAGEVSISRTNMVEEIHTSDYYGPLKDFLKRPVKIASYSWTEGSTFRQTLYPWQAFMNIDSIHNKILNYSKFRGDMKITILINSNPFKFGSMVVAFKPLVAINPSGVNQEARDISGGCIDTTILATANDSLAACLYQRQNVVIRVQDTTKVEMTLPFIWLQDYAYLLKDFTGTGGPFLSLMRLGKLDFCSFTPLTSCAAASVNPITIDVFASIVDPELCGPTLQRESDEYDPQRPISTVASAVAEAANKLSSIPFIGAYATATSLVASTISTIASWFGFSNVNFVGPIQPVKITLATRWADTETMAPLPKLALDPKNELTIDPGVVGLPSTDDMEIETICARPFYCGSTAWQDDSPEGTLLQSGICAPSYHHESNFSTFGTETAIAGQTYKTTTLAPATWVAQNFQFWRGDMKIRFEIDCTKFHKGRLRFIYDPAGWNNAFTEGKVFSRIIDLNEDTSLDIYIPYQGFRPMIEHPRMLYQSDNSCIPAKTGAVFANYGTPMPSTFDVNQTFGVWALYVMTDLSAPLDAPAYIKTFVSFHNNKFSCPVDPFDSETTITEDVSYWTYTAPTTVIRQSGEMLNTSGASSRVPAEVTDDRKLELTCGGETCKSIRQLLHRWNAADVMVVNTVTETNPCGIISVVKRRFPLYHGMSPATTDLNASGVTYHNGGLTSLNYFTPAYTVRKGAINWRFSFIQSNDADTAGSTNWNFGQLEYRSIAISRLLSPLKQYTGTAWSYCGLQETINYFADTHPTSNANTRTFKRRALAVAARALLRGAEVIFSIGPGQVQMPEATIPDYDANRAKSCNSYVDANYINYDGSGADQYSGGFAACNSQRDMFKLDAEVLLPRPYPAATTVAPASVYVGVKSYCCAAPDYSLMGFLNVPSMYHTPTFVDP